MAARWGLKLALDRGLRKIVLNSDSLLLCNAMLGNHIPFHIIGLAQDCLAICNDFYEFFIKYVLEETTPTDVSKAALADLLAN
ncbi:hypothetical protein RIF29_20762 [Crotalaria pallida]|uniref:RNase H type-1 domain-containing protein n=1 Tax=Crotalaria pallida TaxID=3830 RepID=A0AAN9ICR4_CROPI